MDKKGNIAMVILAAGAASRMQAIKQLLPWKKTTLLGNAIEQGLQSNVDRVYVVLGANASKIKKQILNYPIQIIEHKNWQLGIGSSIACAINYFNENNLNYNSVIITLADQPLVNSAYYNLLIERFLTKKEKIITSKTKNKPSVPAIFDVSYFKKLSELNQDKGAKELIQSVPSDVLMVNSDINLVDIDTLETYDVIYNRFGKPES